MKRYFITATGTEVGKTLVTCALTWQLRAQGEKVFAVKPVITGFDAALLEESDTGKLLAAQDLPPSQLHALSPWRFSRPISPDMAAEEEGRPIDMGKLVSFCRQPENYNYLLVEAIGGIMTPLSRTHTVLDWAHMLGYPAILVAGSYLGALSHTLSAAHALLLKGIKLKAVILCESEVSPVPMDRMVQSLTHFLPGGTQICSISRLDSSDDLWKDAPDIISAVV